MKKISIAIALLLACYIFPACNSNSSTESSTTTDSSGMMKDTSLMSTMNDTTSSGMMKSMDSLDSDTKDFVMKATRGGMMEVELGDIAQQQAKSDRVKAFGNMMVSDHTQANDELKSIVSSKNVMVPSSLTPDQQKEVDNLKSKSGAEFDKAYVKMMVDDHKEDIAEFKKASDNLKNADVRGFAEKALPVLQKHLDSIQAIHSHM